MDSTPKEVVLGLGVVEPTFPPAPAATPGRLDEAQGAHRAPLDGGVYVSGAASSSSALPSLADPKGHPLWTRDGV